MISGGRIFAAVTRSHVFRAIGGWTIFSGKRETSCSGNKAAGSTGPQGEEA